MGPGREEREGERDTGGLEGRSQVLACRRYQVERRGSGEIAWRRRGEGKRHERWARDIAISLLSRRSSRCRRVHSSAEWR
eukprot:3568979-Rhodomonas_salina.2